MIKLVQQMIRPLAIRIANMVARGVVQRVDDTPKMQSVQAGVLADETRDDLERVQNYGFTSVPLEGAEAVILFAGGRRDHGLVVAVDDRRYRLKGLEAGEVAIYTDQGDSIVIRRGGTLEVTASTKVAIDSPAVELAGDSEPALKGNSYITAEAHFLAALNAYAAAIAAIADPSGVATSSLSSAISAFTTNGADSMSTKVTLG